MRWTRTLVPTLREEPQEAEIPSHKLMLRAGLIRKLAGGLYTFLPLGLRALYKVEAIIREEMDRAGALELLMPALQPRELWDRTGRYDLMGDVMFRLRDRQDRQMVLGPTHEEVITDLASREVSSYRQLPVTFYQIQTKFRDEIRPRFGLMRAKEFIMKDAYSFDASWEAADKSYQAMYDAYQRIFDRCGLRTKIVEADTGAMGGKWSHEFMVLADAGEDGLAECSACSYAANLERAERRTEPATDATTPLAEVSTPAQRTIEEVSTFLKTEPARLIKTLLYVADGNPIAVLMAGDRELNEHKLTRALDAREVAAADDATILRVTGAPVGFAGPVGLTIPVYADAALQGAANRVTGANKADRHLTGVDLARDAKVTAFHDLVTDREGDACPRCGARLVEKRGIEVGHVFKLGTKYTDALSATFLDEAGVRAPLVMGCYGIGVTRTLQSVIEQSHDEQGIRWPLSVAPYRVAILAMNPAEPNTARAVEELMAALAAEGIDVLYDDRDERPGVKFKDADLVGFPIRVVVGERALAQGCVEVKCRTATEKEMVPVAGAAKHIASLARVC